VMKVVNFAHGEFLMLGTYVTFILFVMSGFNPYLLLFCSVPILIVVGVIVERLCFRPILGTGKLNEIFISLGLIYIFQNAVAMIWTDEWRSLKSPFADMTIALGSIQLPLDYIVIVAITAAILICLNAFLQRTTTGKAIRASSQNRKGAMLMGINVERMDMLTFGIGAGLAGAAGTLWAVSGQVFNPYMGSIPAIKGFVVIILGARQYTGGDRRRSRHRDGRELHVVFHWRIVERRDFVYSPDNRPARPADRALWGG